MCKKKNEYGHVAASSVGGHVAVKKGIIERIEDNTGKPGWFRALLVFVILCVIDCGIGIWFLFTRDNILGIILGTLLFLTLILFLVIREYDRAIINIKEEEANLKAKNEFNSLTYLHENIINTSRQCNLIYMQTRNSFWFAVGTCIGGIVMLGAAIYITMGAESFNVALIPAIGGAITELLAGTALLVYRTSVKQLSYYHRALHENERMLVCVNIIEQQFKEDKERKADMLEKVIMKEMDLSLIEARHFWQEEPNHNKKKRIAVTETEEKN